MLIHSNRRNLSIPSHCSCLSYPGTDFNKLIPISTWNEFDESMTWPLVMWNEEEWKGQTTMRYSNDWAGFNHFLFITFIFIFSPFATCYLNTAHVQKIYSFDSRWPVAIFIRPYHFSSLYVFRYKRVRFFYVHRSLSLLIVSS